MDVLPSCPNLRFAPSPNGLLHLGHAYSAWKTFTLSKALSGRFLLRIEDIDVARSRDEFITAIYEDLAWLGISWPEPVLLQSSRFSAYGQAFEKLDQLGVLYPCFATRSEIAKAVEGADAARDPDGALIYPGLYRDFPRQDAQKLKREGRAFALRIDMQKALELVESRWGTDALSFIEQDEGGQQRVVAVDPMRWGDAIIMRKDVPASYHLAVVVDDAFQGISYVTRGRDLFAATDIHRLLQVLLGLPAPIYHHHRLVEDKDGLKLSKSEGALSLRGLREAGWRAREILARLENLG